MKQKDRWDLLALSYMGKCKSILDLGCGLGRFMSHSPDRITGVDWNRDSVKACKERGYDARYGTVTEIPFGDGSVDAVHCSHVIEHLQPGDAHRMLTEVNRVLRKGGIFCLRTPLMYEGFYMDLTHVKPYYPQAILHYMNPGHEQKTLGKINDAYEVVDLIYRRGHIFSLIPSPRKTGYMLVLRKK